MNVLIAFVEDSTQPDWKGYLYAALLAIVALASAICDSRYWLGVERVGLRLRSAISGAVYRKTLRLSNSAKKTQSGFYQLKICLIISTILYPNIFNYYSFLLYHYIIAGEVVNLLSVDCQKLQDAALFINFMWASPLQVGLAIFFLYQTIGWSVFVGKVKSRVTNVINVDDGSKYRTKIWCLMS